MRDRARFWLKIGLLLLLSQPINSLYQVIWSHRTPADLCWIIVNLKRSGGVTICGLLRWQEDKRTTKWGDGPCRLNWNSVKFFLPFMLLWYHQVDSFVCLASSFSFLPSASSTSSLILLSHYFEWSWFQRMSFCKCLTHKSLKHSPSGCFCLCFVVLNASYIKSPPGPWPVCFISKTPFTISRRKSCSALLSLLRELAYLHRFLMHF